MLERHDRIVGLVVAVRPQPVACLGVDLGRRLDEVKRRVVEDVAQLDQATARLGVGAVIQVAEDREPLDADEQLTKRDLSSHLRWRAYPGTLRPGHERTRRRCGRPRRPRRARRRTRRRAAVATPPRSDRGPRSVPPGEGAPPAAAGSRSGRPRRRARSASAGTRIPVSPDSISDTGPPSATATTGRPLACASSSTWPNVSV